MPLTVALATLITVVLSSLGVYLFAEAKWRHHPLAHSVGELAGQIPV